MGNTVVWKPASTAALSAHYVMRLLQEAGLPDGVINLVYGSGATIGDAALASPELAGIHFTGSTPVFHGMWKTVGEQHRRLPQLPAHRRRDRRQGLHRRPPLRRRRRGGDRDRARLVRVPGPEVLGRVARLRAVEPVAGAARAARRRRSARVKMGDVADFSNFMGAVIDEQLVRDAAGGDRGGARVAARHEIVVGGGYDDSEGFFVEPTVIETDDPGFRTDARGALRPGRDDLRLRRQALGGDARARRRDARRTGSPAPSSPTTAHAIEQAHDALRYAAGNFYVNDKPTGAVVGQQPFGGARASGTNDKAGSMWNLIRWVSPRTIKETFVPPTDYRYPFMGPTATTARTSLGRLGE